MKHEPAPDLERAVLARNGKRVGGEIRSQCPYPERHSNDDATPSARYNIEKQVWCCDACKEGGGKVDLCKLLGVEMASSADSVARYRYTDADGKLIFEVVRKANPKTFLQRRPDGAGGWIWNMKGVQRVLYRLPALLAAVEAKRRIFIVEGEKDADNLAAIGLAATTAAGGAGKWQKSYSRHLAKARAFILPDNDKVGRHHATKVAAALRDDADEVRIVELPGVPTGGDVSDWIKAQAADTDVANALRQLVDEVPQWTPSEVTTRSRAPLTLPYQETDRGLVHLKPGRDGVTEMPLTTFTARIVASIVRDDGAETHHCFEIEAQHEHRTHRFTVPAASFQSLGWVTENLGPTAVVYAGFGAKDHARAAIQLLSTEVAERVVYTHIGWREIGDQWCYLHSQGAIGPSGPVADVVVEIAPQIEHFALPNPSSGAELHEAVRASLRVLDILPDAVTVPLHAGIWRSALGHCDHSIHLSGQTGEGKTEVVALIQQHHGARMDARHLPGSWSSTGNALEVQAFLAKDAILVVDDFAPEGSAFDISRLHREASRVLRSQGNASGRARLRPDGTPRPTRSPRGLLLSTGEDIPAAHSIRARMLVLEVPVGGMNWDLLTQCQQDAAAGLYAQVLAAYVHWLAPRYGQIRDQVRDRATELRAEATSGAAQHKRTPGIVAELGAGLEMFIEFARDTGALTDIEAQTLWNRAWDALLKAADSQASHQVNSDPVLRFLELLPSAIAAGQAHVVGADGATPPNADVWGWRKRDIGGGAYARHDWQAAGAQIGWILGDDLYLDPNAAYKAAQSMASGDGLSMTPQTLWKRLRERGFLAGYDAKRKRNTVRVTLGGARRHALHLKATAVMPTGPSQPSQPSRDLEESRVSGPVSWDDLGGSTEEPSQETGPERPKFEGLAASRGPVGTVGTVPAATKALSDDDWGTV